MSDSTVKTKEETTYCYVARQPGCRCIGVVVVDRPEHVKDTASTVSEALRNGLEVERMTVEAFRALKDKFGCAHDIGMKECRKRGMNNPRSEQRSTASVKAKGEA